MRVHGKNRKKSGQAIIEITLMMPWLAFLFVGILDFGFYAYAAISLQNAARAAALRSSASQYSFSPGTTGNSCIAALGELRGLPNMITVSSCAAAAADITDALPAAVVVVVLDDTTMPPCADCGLGITPTPTSVEATVTYQTLPMIPIPGLVMGRMTMTRIAESRVLVQ